MRKRCQPNSPHKNDNKTQHPWVVGLRMLSQLSSNLKGSAGCRTFWDKRSARSKSLDHLEAHFCTTLHNESPPFDWETLVAFKHQNMMNKYEHQNMKERQLAGCLILDWRICESNPGLESEVRIRSPWLASALHFSQNISACYARRNPLAFRMGS